MAEFVPYLDSLAWPSTFTRIIMHHTWKPVELDWRGLASMAALKKYYRDDVPWTDAQGRKRKGWWSGPNIFVCWGSPNPEWDGIYQGTPVNEPGTHAGECNPDGPGIEVVGDFDKKPWGPELYAILLDLTVALCRKGKMAASSIIGHRDCGSPKTCPGRQIDLDAFRGQVNAVLKTNGVWALWGTEYPLPASQRHFGIPTEWERNMRDSPANQRLGAAKSWPVYDNTQGDFATQLFERGHIIYTNGKAYTTINLARPKPLKTMATIVPDDE